MVRVTYQVYDFQNFTVTTKEADKQFHSDRIAEQMSRAPDVIAIQGRRSAVLFAEILMRSRGIANE